MIDFPFTFTCNQCGNHPPIVIADANWKVTFEVPGKNIQDIVLQLTPNIYKMCVFCLVGTFKRPDLINVSEGDLSVNIVNAWTNLDKELLAEGFITGM